MAFWVKEVGRRPQSDFQEPSAHSRLPSPCPSPRSGRGETAAMAFWLREVRFDRRSRSSTNRALAFRSPHPAPLPQAERGRAKSGEGKSREGEGNAGFFPEPWQNRLLTTIRANGAPSRSGRPAPPSLRDAPLSDITHPGIPTTSSPPRAHHRAWSRDETEAVRNSPDPGDAPARQKRELSSQRDSAVVHA